MANYSLAYWVASVLAVDSDALPDEGAGSAVEREDVVDILYQHCAVGGGRADTNGRYTRVGSGH